MADSLPNKGERGRAGLGWRIAGVVELGCGCLYGLLLDRLLLALALARCERVIPCHVLRTCLRCRARVRLIPGCCLIVCSRRLPRERVIPCHVVRKCLRCRARVRLVPGCCLIVCPWRWTGERVERGPLPSKERSGRAPVGRALTPCADGSLSRRAPLSSPRTALVPCADGSLSRRAPLSSPRTGMGRMTHTHCHTPSLDSNICSIIEPPPNQLSPPANLHLPLLLWRLRMCSTALLRVKLLRVGWVLVRSRRSTASSPNSSRLCPNALCQPIPLH